MKDEAVAEEKKMIVYMVPVKDKFLKTIVERHLGIQPYYEGRPVEIKQQKR